MRKLKALWDLFRLDHALMLVIAVFIGSVIAYNGIPSELWKLTYAFFTAIFLEISSFSLNDYFDYEIDKKNNRTDRPLVRGDISPRTALIFSITFFPLGIASSWMVNRTCFLIALVTGIFALAYDAKLKKIKLIGNFYIAFTMAIPFLFGGVVFSPSPPEIVSILAGIAFLSGVGREMMKDVMDIEGDKGESVRSLPMYVGKRKASMIAGIFYLLAVVLSLFPFFIELDPTFYLDKVYLALVMIPDVLFVYISIVLVVKENPPLKKFRKYTLIALLFGLLAFLAGAMV